MREVILVPVISEKAQRLGEMKKFVFICPISATKPEIKRTVEKLFGVKVKKVNTMIYRGKIKRRGFFIGKKPNFKKAIVTLKEGTIDLTKVTQKFSEALAKGGK